MNILTVMLDNKPFKDSLISTPPIKYNGADVNALVSLTNMSAKYMC